MPRPSDTQTIRPVGGWTVHNLAGDRQGVVQKVLGDNRVEWRADDWGHTVVSSWRWEDTPAGVYREGNEKVASLLAETDSDRIGDLTTAEQAAAIMLRRYGRKARGKTRRRIDRARTGERRDFYHDVMTEIVNLEGSDNG